MNQSFLDAFTALIGNEGGYTVDDGGATMYGITQRVAQDNGYTGDMHDLTIAEAQQIAKTQYWDKFHCDAFDPRVAFQVFDAAYNGGNPVSWLQVAAQVQVDGIIGAQTISAVNSADPMKIILRFDAQRIKYLADLRVWPAYGKGWMNRMANNMILAAK